MNATITKEELEILPVEAFEGKIIVIQTEKEAKKAIEFLKKFDAVGFDTETKPSFKKGTTNKVALLQLATLEYCFLFRLNFIGFPDVLKEFLSNPDVKKIGLSVKDDFGSMRRRENIVPRSFIDIQEIAPKYCIEEKSLQKIFALLFGKKISKNQRLSNWENDILTDAQKKYAATDAWACCKIYQAFQQMTVGSLR